MLECIACLTLLGLWTAAAEGQELRGTVSDSVTRAPLAGAVLTLMDRSGAPLGRGLTNERGEYRLVATPDAERLHVVRMGFRPLEHRIAAGTTTLHLTMRAIPTMLEAVRVSAAASCPRRPDREAALALREQARAGLLTTVVGREAKTAQMVRLLYERTLGKRDVIEAQSVRVDSSETTIPWQAAMSARQFVERGFLDQVQDSVVFYGPDADVLLDDAFANGYCYHLRPTEPSRPNQLGLAFGPASRTRGRVDVDGTLWVDTAARELRDLEFRYLGLARDEEAVRPGGRVSFWEMPNGIVFIDRWSLRLPTVGLDTTWNTQNLPVLRRWTFPRETGGEVASAVWPDGHVYQAPLGILNARAVDAAGKPVADAVIRLMDTDYVASPDAQGFFEISNLLPGPYVATVISPELASIGIAIPTALRFVAQRDSVSQERLLVPNRWTYVLDRCTGTSGTRPAQPWLAVRVMSARGRPVSGARWELRKTGDIEWQRVTETRTTGSDGYIYPCMRLERGDRVELRVWRDGEPPQIKSHRLTKPLGMGRVTLP